MNKVVYPLSNISHPNFLFVNPRLQKGFQCKQISSVLLIIECLPLSIAKEKTRFFTPKLEIFLLFLDLKKCFGTHWKRLIETLPMSTQSIFSRRK